MRTAIWHDCNKQVPDAYPDLLCKRSAGHSGKCWRITPMPHFQHPPKKVTT